MTAVLVHAENRHVEKRVAPIYPEIAKRMRIAGTVRVSCTVAPDGSVTAAKATTGNGLLIPAAEDAVRKWKFVQANAESTEVIDVIFSLDNN